MRIKTPYPPETLGGLRHILCTPGPRDPTKTKTELSEHLLWRYGSAGAGALGAADLGTAQVLLEEVAINPTIEPPNFTGLRKQILGGHKQNLVCTRTQEKGAVTPQETDPDLPVNVQEPRVEVWVGGGLLQGWGHCVQQCVHGTF